MKKSARRFRISALRWFAVALASIVLVTQADLAHAVCGDGTIDGVEQCDLGAGNGLSTTCCTASCTFSPFSQICRAAAGICDVADTCSGSNANCPGDAFRTDTTVCRFAAGPCDVAEQCTGTGPFCPGDTVLAPGTTCGSSSDTDCDDPDSCNGVSAVCQSNPAPGGMTCTDDGNACTDDQCDGAGTCTHPNNAAPCNDGVFCNGADTCNGAACSVHTGDPCAGGAECNDFCNEATNECAVAAGTLCRPAAGTCGDTPEFCDGAGSCPADTFIDSDADGAGNSCDNCSGVSNPDQRNSDCSDPTFFPNGCIATPGLKPGCCDGGDACDACPAQGDNTLCNAQRSASANIGPAGGVVQTSEVNGTIAATVSVPPGALTGATTVSITENGAVTNFSVRKEGAAADLLSFSARPEGQHFLHPVTFTVRWDDRDKDGLVDRGTCRDSGLPCDHDVDCPSSTCTSNVSILEGDLLLKRNSNRFSKAGVGVSPFTCSAHLTGSGCENVHADCSQQPGTGTATVARCCDPSAGPLGTRTYGEWTFETCDFSELTIGLEATGLVPGRGKPATDCVMEWAPLNPLNVPYADSRGLPNAAQSCHDGDGVCDIDGEADGKCTFALGLCFNVDDSRLVDHGTPACTPSDVASWQIVKPRPDSVRPTDQANAIALRTLVEGLGLTTVTGAHQDVIVFSDGPFTDSNECTPLVQVEVPLKGTKKGKATVKAVSSTSTAEEDPDTLKLICLP